MGTGGPPTDAQIEAVVDEFEKTAWAGLEPDRYSLTAVLHREHGGGVYVHVLTAPVRPGDGQEPEHHAARLAEDLRPAARRPEPRARLEPVGRPGAGADAAGKIDVVDQARLRAYIEAANLRAGLEHEADPQ